MASIAFEQLRDVIRADYADLLHTLGLADVPLDIYVVDDDSRERTEHGTERRNGTPGYNGRVVVLPVERGDLEVLGVLNRPYPPTNFERLRWHAWRVDLWHEITHQLQHQKLRMFDLNDGGEGHAVGWTEAIEVMALAHGVDSAVFERLVRRAMR
jgi:hypothetical protein